MTSALAYLKHNKDSFAIRGQVIESIILFPSSDVREGRTKARECVFNEYMSLTARRTLRMANVLDMILEFIKSEISDVIPKKGTVYSCVVDPDDYDSCFQVIAKATLHFSGPSHTGKNIWANLTGGTNVLNAALLQVAFLSGLISRIYYTFIPREDDRKYLQPVKGDPERFRWDEVPFIKTSFDNVYQALLQELKGLGEEWYFDEDLLGRLKQGSWEYLRPEDMQTIDRMDIQTFRQEWLNKLDGRELERQILPDGSQGNMVRLSHAGRRLLERINSPLFQALVQRGREIELENIHEVVGGLEIEELWTK